jgi:hypothetical protein
MWKDNVKRELKYLMCGRRLDLSDSGLGQVANSCEHYASSYFTLCGHFFQLTVYMNATNRQVAVSIGIFQ